MQVPYWSVWINPLHVEDFHLRYITGLDWRTGCPSVYLIKIKGAAILICSNQILISGNRVLAHANTMDMIWIRISIVSDQAWRNIPAILAILSCNLTLPCLSYAQQEVSDSEEQSIDSTDAKSYEMTIRWGGGVGKLKVPFTEQASGDTLDDTAYSVEAGLKLAIWRGTGHYGPLNYLSADKNVGDVKVIDYSETIDLFGLIYSSQFL